MSTGGGALNMAVDLRLLGAEFPIGLLGAVGDDENGAFILEECARLDIDAHEVRSLTRAATSFTDAMVERIGGRRTFFYHLGANAMFDASNAEIEKSSARILHAGVPGVHPLMDAALPDGGNGWSRLLERAQSSGLETNMELASLQSGRLAEVVAPCLPHLDSIVINELEAGALTGVDVVAPDIDAPVDWPAMERMALRLIERGVSSLAVVHFPAGSVAASADGHLWRQGSVNVAREHVLSTTGAGDAFAAGVILGVHEGWAVDACLRLGAASAAACVSSPRTSEGIPSAEAALTQADLAGYRSTVR
jgi:sugar/nucleoside kinase (ribokinase family)